MIIITKEILKIGTRYPLPGMRAVISDKDYKDHYIPFIVLRIATLQDYKDYCEAEAPGQKLTVEDDDVFYEVSVD